MKRHKVVEVFLDISENMQPVTKGHRRETLKGLEKYRATADVIIANGVLEQRQGKDRVAAVRAIQNALKPGGRATCLVAHWSSVSASMSPYSCWPPLSPESFGFFSKEVRDRSGYKDPRIEDIDLDLTYQEIYDPSWENRSDQAKSFASKHYINFVQGVSVTMTKKGKKK